MLLASLIGFIAAILLLFAGYIFGAKRGRLVRRNLQLQLVYSQDKLTRLNMDAENKIDTLLQQSKDLNRVVQPIAEWESQLKKLDGAVKVIHNSVVTKNDVALELTNLKTSAKHRSNLTRLMDEIAEKANFETVLLSDEDGLPIAGNSTIIDLEKLAAISSFVLIFSDRFTRDGAAAPISLLTHDKDKREMLYRIFYIENQRFVLTAISVGLTLTSSALDPALAKIKDILTSSSK